MLNTSFKIREFSLMKTLEKIILISGVIALIIIIYSNNTHVWLANKLRTKTASYIFSISFIGIDFENITIQGDYAECYLTIPKGVQVVQVKEHIPTDDEHKDLWYALRTYYPLYNLHTIWLWDNIRYYDDYIEVVDTYKWRYGYYLAYIKDRVFNSTIKIEFKCRSSGVHLYILNSEAIERVEVYGYAPNGVYDCIYVGYSYWNWKPTFNITISYDKPFMIGIGSYKSWGSKFKFAIKDVYLYYDKIIELPSEVNANIVGVRNFGNIPVRARLKFIKGHGLEKLILKLNGTEQIVVDGNNIIKSEGSWINLKSNEILTINLYARGSRDSQEFYYKVIVECISSVARKKLELVIKSYDTISMM